MRGRSIINRGIGERTVVGCSGIVVAERECRKDGRGPVGVSKEEDVSEDVGVPWGVDVEGGAVLGAL